MNSCHVRPVVGALFASMLVLLGGARPSSASAQATEPQPAAESADEEKARAHFRLGRAHYDNGNFAQAAVEMEEAYRISQRPALLYNIYLAYRDANDTRHAAEALRKYLELEKDVENRGQLESRLAALDRSLADGTAPQPAQPEPQPDEAAADASAPTQPAEAGLVAAPASATQDDVSEPKDNLVPIVLMAGGGALALGGVVMWSVSSGQVGDVEDACKVSEAACKKAQADSSAQGTALVGDLLFFGGLAAAGTGLALFILNQTGGGNGSDDDSAPLADLRCGTSGCIANVRGHF